MAKVERSFIEPVREVDFDKTKFKFENPFINIQAKLELFFLKKGYILFFIGFLLGRALILSKLTPFSIPFFAAVYLIRRDRAPIALVGLVAGAATLSIRDAVSTFTLTLLYLIVYRLSKRWLKNEVKTIPLYVFSILLLGSLAEGYFYSQTIVLYDLIMAGVEAGLGFILTLIFLQSLPLLSITKRRQSLKTEEIVCLIILLASVMTGTIGWTVYDLSIEHIFSRYLVLLFAFVAGATVGSTVGVVTGLIFSLASVSSFFHMSLLAFAGLLGGLLKEGNKIGAAIGLFIATLLLGMYGDGNTNLIKTISETTAAVVLFFFTPNSLTSKLAKYIPGTAEHLQEQQIYMRKMRDVTAQRVAQFSSVFRALSDSFARHDEILEIDDVDRELDYFLGNVTEKTCQLCHRKEKCWTKHFTTTYEYMKQIMLEMEQREDGVSQKLYREFETYCIKPKKVIEVMDQELTFYQANQKLKKQVKESRKLVADQLLGVSEVMDNFSKEIQREREHHHKQEELILEALQDFGIEIENVDVYSLEQGNVDIEITLPEYTEHGECEKIIAPMLSDILGENILVSKEAFAPEATDFYHVTFRSAKTYTIETGIAHAAKDGGLISGDSYSTIELGGGKYAIAISDGMGNGERAHMESQETLQLLQKILQSGIEEQVAIKSVNSVLSLRTTDEIFSTLDLAVVDLQNAATKFLKIGSIPSFIKRGDKVIKIQANNLPMGIIQEMEVDVVSEQLKAGDLLIMMSDGVFEGPPHVENYDIWMKRKISELETEEPQEVADLIIEEVIRSSSGQIADDMTVVVAKIKHNTPRWASIPVLKYRQKAN